MSDTNESNPQVETGVEDTPEGFEIHSYTYGSSRDTRVSIIYPRAVDLLKISNRRGSYTVDLDVATVHVENRDSNKNRHRRFVIIPKTTIVVRYYGRVSYSKKVDDFILLQPGKKPVDLEPKVEVREESVGNHKITKEIVYIIVDDKRLNVHERVVDTKKTKLQAKIVVINNKVYVMGDTYNIKDKLKVYGFRWDPDRRMWYTNKYTVEQAKEIINNIGVEVEQ